jgi:hypothetical protein
MEAKRDKLADTMLNVMREREQTILNTMQERVQAILNTMQEREQAIPSFGVQDAIRTLNDEYHSKLSAEEFLSAISILKDQSNAAVFCMLGPGDMRERWLSSEMAKASRQ